MILEDDVEMLQELNNVLRDTICVKNLCKRCKLYKHGSCLRRVLERATDEVKGLKEKQDKKRGIL